MLPRAEHCECAKASTLWFIWKKLYTVVAMGQQLLYCMQQRAENSVCATATTLWFTEKVGYCCDHAANSYYTVCSKEQGIVYVQQQARCSKWKKLDTVVAMQPTAIKFMYTVFVEKLFVLLRALCGCARTTKS
jgi:hypothetical protein